MKKWYLYDKDSNAYKFSYILSDTQPDNSTEVDPGDKVNPKWAGSDWVEGVVVEPAPTKTTIQSPQDQINAQLLKSFATQQLTNATLVKQIAELQKGGN